MSSDDRLRVVPEVMNVPCLARHPERDEPCVRTDAHRRHRSETPFPDGPNGRTYHAVNCWTWVE